jgi:HEAT repeat protein
MDMCDQAQLWALGQLDSEAAVPGLLQALQDSDGYVRSSAAVALGQLDSEAAVPGLLQLLQDPDRGVRWSVARALGNINSEIAVKAIDQIARTRGPDLREIAIEALGRCSDGTTITPLTKALIIVTLVNALRDKHLSVRGNAVEALARIGMPQLLKMLWQQQLTISSADTYLIISAIQNRCNFYNYEIWQEAVTTQDIAKESLEAKPAPTRNIFPNATEVKIIERVEHYHENPPGSGQ